MQGTKLAGPEVETKLASVGANSQPLWYRRPNMLSPFPKGGRVSNRIIHMVCGAERAAHLTVRFDTRGVARFGVTTRSRLRIATTARPPAGATPRSFAPPA